MSILKTLLPAQILYVKIMKDKLIVKNIKSGQVIERTTQTPFSNERLLIAYFENADKLFKEITIELFKSDILDRNYHMLLQPVDSAIKEITPVEYRIYNDFAQFGGASKVIVYPTQENLTDNEVLEKLKR